ncbi:MAG: tetratricopeptide repeat-containing glycosyltransferase family 2 protein [Gaiellaceae bacterium]
MALRTVKIATDQAAQPRTREEWQRQVEETVSTAARALDAGSYDELKPLYASVATWDDRQRAYQAHCNLLHLVSQVSGELSAELLISLYEVTLEIVFDALDAEPTEPVLLNAAGTLLYELLDDGGSEALFRSAAKLDPDLPHVRKNLKAVRARKKGRARSPRRGESARKLAALSARGRRIAATARPTKGLRLSLCMIVKDEEEMLPGCLEAVADAVDEIVIVDTGSSDRTVEIAESFGARVVDFPWNGSFADARNVSLDTATGDWILYLDADEHIVPGDANRLRSLTSRTWREGFYLVETNYTGGDDSGSAVTHLALRLFRNRPEYRFEGRIHEQKTQAMPTFLPERFETTTVRIRHYGYLSSRINQKDKSRRNIELLEQDARENRDAFALFNLGSEYLALAEADQAREHFDEAWQRVLADEHLLGEGYVPLLASRVVRARREAQDIEAARTAADEGLRVFPDHTDLVFEAALCALAIDDLDAARLHATTCLDMGDAPARYSATVGSGSFLALNLLGEIAQRQGNPEAAEEVWRRSLAEHPNYLAPVLPLATTMFDRGATPAEVEREIPLERPSAVLLAATACYEARHAEAAVEWFCRVLERQPANGAARIGLVESLLSLRRYDDAIEEAAKEPDDSPVRAQAAVTQLFALAVSGNTRALGDALIGTEGSRVAADELQLYRAWHRILSGEGPPAALPADVAAPASTALEALLRIEEVDAFAALLPVYEATALDERERRELLAQIYLRRGFLDSAAEEWISVAQQTPDAHAMIGLSQVALAQGLTEDALVFAENATALEPASERARKYRRALEERAATVS